MRFHAAHPSTSPAFEQLVMAHSKPDRRVLAVLLDDLVGGAVNVE